MKESVRAVLSNQFLKSAIHGVKLPLTTGGAHWLLTAYANAYWLTESLDQIGVDMWSEQPVGTAGGQRKFFLNVSWVLAWEILYFRLLDKI